jgi:hypothetical protein
MVPGAALEQVCELALLGAGEAAEERRLGEAGDQALARIDSRRRERQHRDAPIAVGARAAHEAPLLEAIGEEGDVGRVAVQALGERTPRERAERGIELPQRVGERHREAELVEGFVQLRFDGCMERVCRPGELVRVRAGFCHGGIVWPREDFTRC